MTTDPLFHMIVDDVFFIAKRGTVVTGRVDTGSVKAGDSVMIRGKKGERNTVVTGIEAFRKVITEAQAGDNIGLLLKDVTKDQVQRGDELLGPGEDFTWKP